ncbi:MAG TPA: HAMP domain-containing sensor histidine kinase [Acidobacteriota bacterium]|nr:HAMP domain-containing sensor histidine kinase [Acidobacteriota bacterium]HQO19255.1 HAMP domain-containing sensor histidine kinase [Acidobacteriota bacterium]HQQ46067.1 HAMP domain-containing sensor histidine kinase [Acidobacteriota bacterium]
MAKKDKTAGGIEEVIKELVLSAKGPMFYMNPEANFVMGNAAYQKVRPAVRAQVLHRHAEAEKLLRLAAGGTPVSRQGKLSGDDYLLTLAPVCSGLKGRYFILGSLTRHYAAERNEGQASESSFLLRTMAHELKTPLSNIFLTLDLLINECGREKKDDNRTKMLQRMKRQSFQLMELIDNFLDMARSKEGLFEPMFEKFELSELIEDVEETIRPFTSGRGLKWKLTKSSSLPKEIESDPEMVKRILLNFLSNACKFTESGTISMAVRKVAGSVVFEISDSGCGISREDMETIFVPFTRGSLIGTRASGFGLGLSIAKMFADALKGRIELESEVGRGSRFTLVLPARHHGKKD